MSSLPKPFFLDGPAGRAFAVFMPAEGAPKGALLHVPAFAEEMNRCRFTVATQARRLNALGYACLLLDPYGTGDSEGELSDASWEGWLGDVEAAAEWLADECGAEITLWGLRLGALLAADAADRSPERFRKLLFWQPVLDGRLFLTQYLRLRVAYLMDKGLPPETTESIRSALAAGEVLEVAGYPLSGRLANQLDKVRMTDLRNLDQASIDWLELVGDADRPLPPASQKAIAHLSAGGCRVRTLSFTGPPIWQLHKRDQLPQLIELTDTLYREGS